jgi:hypothetical protein
VRYRSPQLVATRTLERIDERALVTAGQWADVLFEVSCLPPRLQEWTWQQIEARLGADVVQYLKTWSESTVQLQGVRT